MPLGALKLWTMRSLVIVVLCVHVISSVITAVCSGLIFAERIFGPQLSCAKLHRGFFDKTGESWESKLESGIADSSTIQFQNLQPKQTQPTTWTSRQQYYPQPTTKTGRGSSNPHHGISKSSEISYWLIWKHRKHQSMLWFDFWIFASARLKNKINRAPCDKVQSSRFAI